MEKGRKEGRIWVLFREEEIEIKKLANGELILIISIVFQGIQDSKSLFQNLKHIDVGFKKSHGFHTQSLVKVPHAMTLLSLHYVLNKSFINKDHLK